MVHGDLPPAAQLARVAEIVRAHRRPGAERHPLNQLAPRALAASRPGGGSGRRSAWPSCTRRRRPSRGPTCATRPIAVARSAWTAPGADVVVACSVGIHLDLVPAAADARAAARPGARLLLVVPERDAHPVTRALAARLVAPGRARRPRRRLAL